MSDLNVAPFRCKFCGMPSWLESSEQTPPVDYCHESDHGEPEACAGLMDEGGGSVVPAHGRVVVHIGSCDLAGFKCGSEAEAKQILSNARVKFFMRADGTGLAPAKP